MRDFADGERSFFVELSAPRIALRVIRERGQGFVDVRAQEDPGTWFDLDAILRLLKADAESRREVASGNASLESLASIVNRYLGDIEAHFDKAGYRETKTRLSGILDKRAEERWGPL
jgi:hypothetical protein